MKIQLLKIIAVVVLAGCSKIDPEWQYISAVQGEIKTQVTRPSDMVFAPRKEVLVKDAGGGLYVISGWTEVKNDYGTPARIGYLAHVGMDQYTKKPLVITLKFMNPVTGDPIEK